MRERRSIRLRAAVLALAFTLGVGAVPRPSRAQQDEGTTADPVAAPDGYDPFFDDQEEAPLRADTDPLEGANRKVFWFNNQLGRWVLDPFTDTYRFLVPAPIRRSVNRVILNLNSPVIFANQVLQLRPCAAARTVGRFAANTTLGVVGVFDFAGDVMGMPRTEADFGQTLGRYGVPMGAYLMIPVLGPTTARDVVGSVVDYLLDPITYVVGPLNLEWQLILGSGEGLSTYDAREDEYDALRQASVDFYAALRSAYLQSRRAAALEARNDSRDALRVVLPIEEAAAPEADLPAL